MADVASDLKTWSTTASSNSPSGSTAVGTGLNDNLQEIQKVVRQDLATKGADIASAATTDLGAVAGLMHDITGNTSITSFGTVSAGIWKFIKFEGALTLTHNATSLILPGGANITTADGDVAIVISEGSGNWRCLSYFRAGSQINLTSGTEQASTSGTSIDFTSIPSWAKRITVQFVGVSTDGTSSLVMQLGDSGGIEASGYLSAATVITTGVSTANHTTGLLLTNSSAATAVYHGSIVLTLEDAANFTWVSSGTLIQSDSAAVVVSAGSKSTSAALDRIRITTAGGTDAFDAGAINILYE